MKIIFKKFRTPTILVILFVISKLILNNYDLEYLSWVYYALALSVTIYLFTVIIYLIIKSKLLKLEKTTYILTTFLVFSIIYLCLFEILSLVVGQDKRLVNNKELVKNEVRLGLKSQYEYYEYKSIFVRGKIKKICIDICN